MAASTRLLVRSFFHAVPYGIGGICICPAGVIGPAETLACASGPESPRRDCGAFTDEGVNAIRKIVVMKNTPAAILIPLQLVRAIPPAGGLPIGRLSYSWLDISWLQTPELPKMPEMNEDAYRCPNKAKQEEEFRMKKIGFEIRLCNW
jgi:hypothetical protein